MATQNECVFLVIGTKIRHQLPNASHDRRNKQFIVVRLPPLDQLKIQQRPDSQVMMIRPIVRIDRVANRLSSRPEYLSQAGICKLCPIFRNQKIDQDNDRCQISLTQLFGKCVKEH